MRPTAFILIVYILFLLTQPCQDVLGAPPSFDADASVTWNADEEDCEEGQDGCSPFCICSCRQAPAGHFFYEPAIEPKILITPSRSSEIDCRCLVSVASLNSIWQPPKH